VARTPASEPRARLFVALDLPRELRSELGEWQRRAVGDGLRAVDLEALHVTLAFLGGRPESEVGVVSAAVRAAVAGLAAPRLRVTGVSGVPPRRPRLFALDLADEDGRAAAVQAAVSEALVAGGWYEPERRAFWPHVTVARVRGRGRVGPAVPAEGLPGEPFDARAVTLYRSHLGGGRPARYEALERVELQR
jgi:2'-5' RNA ligase